MSEQQNQKPADDFDRAWRDVFAQFLPQLVLTTALFELTGIGERPVEIGRLAAAIGRPPDEGASRKVDDLGTCFAVSFLASRLELPGPAAGGVQNSCAHSRCV